MAENPNDQTENDDNNSNAIIFDYKKGVKHLVDTSPHMNKLLSQYILKLPKSPLSAAIADVPVIDLHGLNNGHPESRVSAVKAISSACESWGFFRIVNHGIKMSVMEEMVKVADEFFELSWDEKMKYGSEDVMSPVRYGTSLNTSKKHSLHWRDYFRHYGHQNTLHLWPLNTPNYRNVAKEYLEEIWNLAMRIGGAISEGLGLDQNYLEDSFGEGLQILVANYYPKCPQPEKTLGLAAHSDHGALTILMQNGVNGLQIKHNQDWVSVHHVPGTFLVNVGDCLEILSNGKYKSVEHRATVDAQRTRISIAVGHGPALSSTIGPASQLVDQNDEAHYRPITYKDYIELQQSSTIRGKSALQAVATK
ncbi:hypothetical protein ABFX02_13G023700 [Erythranthe guttata]